MDYTTVIGEAVAEYEIQRSVFICSIKGISSFEEGLNFVKTISKKYSDATHNCYGLLCINGEQKFSDDGEPQGTAGLPILQVLKKSDLNNVVCVVTRYFGGIKLGAGGLVSAYTKSAADGVTAAKKAVMKDSFLYTVETSYSDNETLARLLEKNGCSVKNKAYGGIITTVFAAPVSEADTLLKQFNDTFKGKITPVLTERLYTSY